MTDEKKSYPDNFFMTLKIGLIDLLNGDFDKAEKRFRGEAEKVIQGALKKIREYREIYASEQKAKKE